MRKHLTAIAILFILTYSGLKAQGTLTISSSNASDLKFMDYTKGYYSDHKPDLATRINLRAKWTPLASFDFNGDGQKDTVFFKMNETAGKFATVVVYDEKEDDWRTLFKQNMANMSSDDVIWFYQSTFPGAAAPFWVVYNQNHSDKFCTLIQYDAANKTFTNKDYKLFAKNLFPHKFLVNKKKIQNQNGSTEQIFEDVLME